MPSKKPPENVLLVDDETIILQSFRRQLHNLFNVTTADGPFQAQKIIRESGPFAVVVSDMKMPGMDGAELLSWVHKNSPDTVRIILTGYSEMDNAVKAINEGHIFRFLTKPCEQDLLVRTLVDGIRQYRLEIAEHQLLEQTLSGSVKLLTDLLSLAKPLAFGRSARAARYMRMVVSELELEDPWQYYTAAMLSQIGCLELSDDLLTKAYSGKDLTDIESKFFDRHPKNGADLLKNIPRLGTVSKIIGGQADYDDYLCTGDTGEQNIGSCILKAVLDMDTFELQGLAKAEALAHMRKTHGRYHPDVLMALEGVLGLEAHYIPRGVEIKHLENNMILNQDITGNGHLILSKGQQLSRTLIISLRNYHLASPLEEPVKVLIPHDH